jgi:hypothetical protein
MKVVLTLALIALTATLQTQTGTEASPDLVVLKFSWTKYVTGGGLIRPVEAAPAPGPVSINRDPTRDPNYQRPAANPTERHAEMAALERDAALSANRSSNLYVIRIQVKNAGTKPIKSFVWAPEDPAGVPDLATRQFLCAVKTKPNEAKALEMVSTLAPSSVVDVSKSGEKAERSKTLSAVINRIEYVDGSVWQRPGWDSSILSRDPRRKVDNSKCVRL